MKVNSYQAANKEQDRLLDLLHHAAQCCAELDHGFDLESLDPALPVVLLSVKLLIQSLDLGLWLDTQLHKPPHNDVPSIFPLREAMLRERGWCFHHVQELGRANTYHALFYLASLRRYPGPWIDHSDCHTKDQCTAYNVNEETHRVLHVDENCQCTAIKAPKTNLAIIDSGNIPFVQCERRKGSPPKITHGVVQPGTKYVAISHIWSDGLGNLLANELPQCQLDRILDRVEALQAEFAGTSPDSLIQQFQRKCEPLRNTLFGPPTTQVNFWMDVFCNPVVEKDADPAHAERLKRGLAMGISRLMPTYIFAEHVLILDYEIQQVPRSQGQTELLSRLAVSGWRSRCWTHQEYCFSRRPVYQCADGLGPLIRREEATGGKGWNMEESVRLELQNLSPTALQSTPAVQDPLSTVLGLGYTSKSPEDLDRQRGFRFIRVWNDLSRKNITHNYDSLEILANLLELRAGDLLGLSPKGQMKAVLASHKRLPMDLLFSSTKRHWEIEDERWIPLFPKGGEPLRERTLQVELTKSGVLIPSSHFGDGRGEEQDCSVMAVQVLDTSGHDWVLDIPNSSHEPLKKIWISLQDTDGQDLRSVPETSDVIFILDTSPSAFQTTTRGGRPGCCLIVRKSASLEQEETQTSYICPVLWGIGTSSSKNQSPNAVMGDLLSANSPNILITSSISSWPHLSPRQNLFMPPSFGPLAAHTFTLLLYMLTVVLLLILCFLPLTPSAWYITIGAAIVAEQFFAPIARRVAEICVQRASDYLQLQSFEPDWTAEEPVVRRLGKALGMRDGGVAPWRTRGVVRLLRGLLWVYGDGL